MSSFESESNRVIVPTAMMLLVMLLFVGACSDKESSNQERDSQGEKTEVADVTTSPATTRQERTRESQPPEITLGEDARGQPEVFIRLEGDTNTTFSGLCSVGEEQNVLSGQVPKRYAFDLRGRQLSCRIEKQNGGTGDLKVVLVAGESTRSVQQTNTPGSVINVAYRGE